MHTRHTRARAQTHPHTRVRTPSQERTNGHTLTHTYARVRAHMHVSFTNRGFELGKVSCPRFAEGKPKNDLDWILKRASEMPGPGDPVRLPGPSGGVISTANPKSELDWILLESESRPGPGSYGALTPPGPSGGQFSNAFPRNALDQLIFDKKDQPGPCTYTLKDNISQMSTGRFNLSNPKNDLEWKVRVCPMSVCTFHAHTQSCLPVRTHACAHTRAHTHTHSHALTHAYTHTASSNQGSAWTRAVYQHPVIVE
jgi:hypothetical protein